ncbi:MAG TPA: Rossmann-like and DUF2520 domain-containing protein [Syntrophorhabdaceae bacterium]|nr:Rossmann-like and DUF2520 domain-containing protein [Syntrophorhabdaceae bacterium]
MKIGIIGAGKVGISLAYTLKHKGFDVTAISDRLASSLDQARTFLGKDILYTDSNVSVVHASDVVAVTTQDRAIQGVAEEIYEKAKSLEGKLIFHTSGADPSSLLKPLDEKGALLGSLHPLQTFPDIKSAVAVLPETCIFVEGDEKALATLSILGEHLGARVYTIAGEDKVLYHLSAVFVCNLLCALFYAGRGLMDKINVDFAPFLPIIRATLKNIESKGPLQSLTGPVVRGDVKTVKAHLQSMKGMELNTKVYRALSEVACEMARERGAISEDVVQALLDALNET